MSDNLSKWSELWTTRAKDHALIRVLDDGRQGNSFTIFNVKQRGILMIEDDRLATEIVEHMRNAGVPILDHFPVDPIDKLVDEMFAAGKGLNEINEFRRRYFEERCSPGVD